MEVLKKIIEILIVIILSIMIIASVCVNIASSTILEQDYLISKLDETDYYSRVYEYVESNFKNYIYQSGFDEEILEDIVTKEKIKQDTKIIVKNIYEGTDIKLNTDEIKENLNKNIEQYMITNKLHVKNKSSLESFVNMICEEYEDTLIHTKYENQINNVYQKIIKYRNLADKAILIVIVICTIMLIVLNIKQIYMFLLPVGQSLFVCGTFFTITKFYVEKNIDIPNITLLNEAFSNVIEKVLFDLLGRIMNYGIIFIIIGLLLIIISNVFKSIKNNSLYNKS